MLSLQVVFGVSYVKASSLPLIGILLPILLKGIQEGLHSLRVTRLVLLQVHQVETVRETY